MVSFISLRQPYLTEMTARVWQMSAPWVWRNHPGNEQECSNYSGLQKVYIITYCNMCPPLYLVSMATVSDRVGCRSVILLSPRVSASPSLPLLILLILSFMSKLNLYVVIIYQVAKKLDKHIFRHIFQKFYDITIFIKWNICYHIFKKYSEY